MTKHTENSERGKPLGLPLNDVLGAFLCYKKDVDRRPLRYYSNYIDNANDAAK